MNTPLENTNTGQQPNLIDVVMGNGTKPAEVVVPSTDTPPPVDKIGSVPVTDFASALAEITGNKITDPQVLRDLPSQIDELNALRTRVSEWDAAPKTTFANDFVKKLNDLVSSGADHAKIEHFWRLANTDIQSLPALDVLVLQTQIENPSLSKDQVQAYVLHNLGVQANDDGSVDINALPAATAARIQIEANKARTALQSEVTKFDAVQAKPTTEDPSIAQARELQANAAVTYWGEVLTAVPAEIPFSYADAERGIPEYSFKFTPRPEVISASRDALMQMVKSDPDAFPKTQEGAKVLQENYRRLVAAYSQEDFQKALFLDVFHSAIAMAKATVSGQPPKRTDPYPAQDPNVPRKKSLAEAMSGK